MPELERGALVRFRIRDVFYPDVVETLRQVTAEAQVCGRLLFFSDSGPQRYRYAVVEVSGMSSPVIVAVEHLQVISLQQSASPVSPDSLPVSQEEEFR